jgi:hypothetical protein
MTTLTEIAHRRREVEHKARLQKCKLNSFNSGWGTGAGFFEYSDELSNYIAANNYLTG